MAVPPPIPVGARRLDASAIDAVPADVPAGFLRRSVAWSLDAALCAAPVLLLGWPLSRSAIDALHREYDALLALSMRSMIGALESGLSPLEIAPRWLGDASLRAASDALQSSLWSLAWPLLLATFVVGALYHVVMEASVRGATLGQRALSLRVVGDPAPRAGTRSMSRVIGTTSGARIGPGRALMRHVAGIASWLTLNLGHALALLPPSHRALHDRIAGTRMVQARGVGALPAWAWAWLALLVAVQTWAIFAWVSSSRATIEAALDAAQTASVSVSPVVSSVTPQTSRHMKYITPNITT